MVQHVITIASSVTKVRWRPPAFDATSAGNGEEEVDRHDSMFAVATARLTSAGGSGVISLWSTHRPFMPLSVVEGHEEGAVADFVWMHTPRPEAETQIYSRKDQRDRHQGAPFKNDDTVLIRSGGHGDVESTLVDNQESGKSSSNAIWQHIVSVGRDGKCILQSFVRGKCEVADKQVDVFRAISNLGLLRRPSNLKGPFVLLRNGEPVSFSKGLRFSSTVLCPSAGAQWCRE